MKYLIFSDVHWSKNTSIVCSKGRKYSTRIEYLIKSMNWLNKLALDNCCNAMICLGDFFDKDIVRADEITPLKEIEWNNLKTYYLVGNHESNVATLEYSTVDIFRNNNVEIVSAPKIMSDNNCNFLFLPYITEDNRRPLESYIEDFKDELNKNKKLVILSHNDLKGINYGPYTSVVGFDLEEINGSCDLFLNGHLHNSEWVSSKVLNVGSLSAHNFTNDSSKYSYGVWILDTDTLEIEFIKNPYAMNFYKLEINEEVNIGQLKFLRENAVVSIKCDESLKDALEKELNKINLLCCKVCYYQKEITGEAGINISELQTVDHLEKFKQFVIDKLGRTEVVLAELSEVCK